MVVFVALTFVLILALVLGAYWAFVVRLDESDDAALRKRLRPERISTGATNTKLLKPSEQLGRVSRLNAVLEHMGRVAEPMQRNITQAGLSFTVATLLLSSGCLALAT